MDIITSHQNADFDSLASMVAASKLYPKAKIVFPGSMADNLHQYLNQHPEIKHYKPRQIKNSLVKRIILVDASPIGHYSSLSPLLNDPNVIIHVYDHHPYQPSKIKTELEVIQKVGATTTIMVNLLRKKQIPINVQEATLCALGIYEDTGFLTFKSTTETDLETVAYLLKIGADLSLIPDFIKRELSSEQIALLNELIQTAQNIVIHGVPIQIATASREDYVGDVAVLAHKLRDIENIGVLFLLLRLEGRVHMVARSRVTEVNVGEVLHFFGGGGHATAASATVHDLTLIQIQEKLLKVLEEEIPPQKLADQIMTSPAKTISGAASVTEAKELFLRHSVNNLPVVDSEGELQGIINRQIVDKALAHGLKTISVNDVMYSDVHTVSPKDDLDTVKHRMMERHQQFLPVVTNKQVVGIITRTDLLRILHEKMPPVSPDTSRLRAYPQKKNLKGLLRERLPKKILDILHLAGEVADELGLGIYVVGGLVRDMLLREKNLDLDLVVEKDGIMFARHFAERVGGHHRAYAKFATAVVVFPDGFKLDVATARTEYYQYPAALPIVEQSSIKLDLYRRDFTINALAIKLNPKQFGSLIDFFGGQQDLKNGVIRVLHSLSLVEDPTRVFRAIRFEQRFGFRIGKHTLNLIRNAVRDGICSYLDSNRFFNELRMIFQETDPSKSIQRMSELDLLKFIHPDLKPGYKELQVFSRIKTALDWYNLLFLKQEVERWLLYILGLASYLNPAQSIELAQRLALSEKHTHALIQVHEQIPTLLSQLQRKKTYTDSQIYTILNHIPLETLLLVMAKSGSSLAKQRLSKYLTKLQHKHVLISGENLKELGFPTGPLIGQIKEDLLHARLDGKVKSKEDEITWVKKYYQQ